MRPFNNPLRSFVGCFSSFQVVDDISFEETAVPTRINAKPQAEAGGANKTHPNREQFAQVNPRMKTAKASTFKTRRKCLQERLQAAEEARDMALQEAAKLQQALITKEEQVKEVKMELSQTQLKLQEAQRLSHLPPGATVTFDKEGKKEGGFGEVCPVTISFQAAAKIPHDSAEAVADLHNEAAALAAIPPHRHIIGSFGLFPVPDRENVLLLELAKGDLSDLYKEVSKMDKAELLEVMLQIVEGVRHIHAAGYIHRDLKPDNTLMGTDGLVKLCDFGCAAKIGNTAHLSRKGTLPFMSPWTVADRADPGLHDDMRGVAATLYELMCGRPLFNDLLEQFQQLDPKKRAQAEKACIQLGIYREDDIGPTVAIAEYRRYIGIKEIVPVVEGLSEKLLYAVRLGITEPQSQSLDTLAAILAYDIEASRPIAGAITEPATSLQLQSAESAAAAPEPSPVSQVPTSAAAADASSEDILPCRADIFAGSPKAAMPADSRPLQIECLRPASAAQGTPVLESRSVSAPIRDAAAEPAHDTYGWRKTSGQCMSGMEDPFGGVPRDVGADIAPGSDDLFGGVPPQAAAAQAAPPVPVGDICASAFQLAAAAQHVPDASVYIWSDLFPKVAPAAQFDPAAMGLFPGLPCGAPAAWLPPSGPANLIPGMPSRAVACA